MAEVQEPLCTTARYRVVCVRFVYVCVVVVLLMVDQLAPLSVDDSQRTTLPVWPDKVIDPLLLPEQTPVLPLTVPPADAGVTVIVEAVELAGAQEPLCTCARYWVVWVTFVYVSKVVVLLIGVQLAPLSVEYSQRITVPV